MISSRFLLPLLFVLASPLFSFAYNLPIRTSAAAVDYTSASDVGSFLAFNIFKLSLSKNNIPYDFASTGMYQSVSGQEYASCASINSIYLHTSGGGVCNVVLWPRDVIVNHTCVCDYAVCCVFSGVRPSGSTYPVSWYIYFDYGVVSITNYLGADYSTSFQDKSVSLLSNVSNSMPILVSDKGMTYFQNKIRVYNIYQNLTNTGNISAFKYGSLVEFNNAVSEALIKYSGSTYSTWSGDNSYSLQTLGLLRQSSLPWQMQVFNSSFNETGKTRPDGIGVVDTDGGSEPDASEYYTGHDYLVPSDDWGQPADIGSGSGSGVGGEVELFGPQAEQQLQDAIEQGTSDGLENYFGSSSDIDAPTLDSGSYDEDLEDIDPDDYWLSDSSSATADLLPAGASTFQTLVDRLKSPDNASLPVWTLDLSVDTGNIAGVIWQGATVDIDLNTLLSNSNNWVRTLRTIAVICMYVAVIIYLLKDNLLLGGNASADGE